MFHSRVFRFLAHLICLLVLSSTQIAAISNRAPQIKGQNPGTIKQISNMNSASGRDIVLIIDTSASMAYETSGSLFSSDAGDDPSVCNLNNTCQPMATVKSAAIDLVDQLNFAIDRVSIITMTSQTPSGSRAPIQLLPLSTNKAAVQAAINSIKVYEPPVCNGTSNRYSGVCRFYSSGTYVAMLCEYQQLNSFTADPDPSACPSSNIGGTLSLAGYSLAGSGNVADQRPDAQWMVVALLGGPANATDTTVTYPNGFCPQNTWWQSPWCRDRRPSVRHQASDPLVNFTNPVSQSTSAISLYDADDYARDMADYLATLRDDGGVTIYTIGFGSQITSTSTVESGENPAAEDLLTYMATCAGEDDLGDCSDVTEEQINHGQYFYAPTASGLAAILEVIAEDTACDPSEVTVANVLDNGAGSLRQAIADVCTSGTISFDSSLAGQTIHLASTLTLSRDVTIDASALSEKIIISGDSDNDNDGDILILNINTDKTVVLKNLTFTKGYSPFGTGVGAIENLGNLSIYDSQFESNSAGQCVAIRNSDIMYVENSNFVNNTANYGGAIFNIGMTEIKNSTIISNSATTGGGGIVNSWNSDGTIEIMNSIISDNSSSYGGGIFNFPLDGNITMENSILSNNEALNHGGGVSSFGTLIIKNVTAFNNSANLGGGVFSTGVLTSNNSTFSENSATNGGGGIANFGTLNYTNTIIANSLSGGDCTNDDSISTNINNLVEDGGCAPALSNDPMLGPLADNGGFTQTMALLLGSPAIDAGDNATCESTDQRGLSRPQGIVCDIGAFEYSFKDITAFSFTTTGATGVITGTDIAVTVPFGTNLTALVGAFTTTGASVKVGATTQVSGTTANDFTSPVTYRVIAADATTKDYVVTVTVAANSAKDITAFSFTNPAATGVITGTDIAVTVPYGTNRSALVATFTSTGDSVKVGATTQVSGTTANDFTSPVTYRVTAADTTTKDYTVTVTVGANSAKDITAFSFTSPAATGVITGTDIAVTVPFGTNRSALVATFTSTGDSVKVGATTQVSGTTANDFTSPVTYRVIAADTTTKDYIVTVTLGAVPAADVEVNIGGAVVGTYPNLAPGSSQRVNYADLDSGPVVVNSTNSVDIIAAIRDAWAVNGVTTSFSQLMGLPLSQVSDKYVFPGYNNVTLNEQLRIGNVDTVATQVTVTIGGVLRGTYDLDPDEAVRINYAGLDSGPVIVDGTDGVDIIAAIREAWMVNGQTRSFVQVMGLPSSQLSDKYVFPAYNNVTLNEQLRIGNVDTVPTTVMVTIGGVLRGTYDLDPDEAVRINYAGLDSGPVIVDGTDGVDIISSIRDAWQVNGVTTSFSQLMGMPAGGLSDTYIFPAYNNVTLDEQLRIGNVDTVATQVTVTIGGVLQGTYDLDPDEAVRINYPGLDSGPVVVAGTDGVDIISAIREAWAVNGVTQSFVQLMGLPFEQLSTTYLFPAYNNVTLNEQLRFAVP